MGRYCILSITCRILTASPKLRGEENKLSSIAILVSELHLPNRG